jgi:hypothetical protein
VVNRFGRPNRPPLAINDPVTLARVGAKRPDRTMTRSVTYDPANPQRPRPNHVDHEVLVRFESIQARKNLVINIVIWCTTASRHRSS